MKENSSMNCVACSSMYSCTDIVALYGHINEYYIWFNSNIVMDVFLLTCLE